MMKKSLSLRSFALAPAVALTLLFSAGGVLAQSTPAKKELAARILKLQQPGIEALARSLAEQPAADILDRADAALPQRVAADKRDAVAADIQADAKKYLDEAVPLVQDRAIKLAPSTSGALLEAKFSEAELKQLAAMLEAPAYLKFQQIGGDMKNALLEKLIADTRPTIEPKVKALEMSVARRLGVTDAPAKPASR